MLVHNFRRFIAGASLLALLASCGGDDGSLPVAAQSSSAPSPSPTATATPTPVAYTGAVYAGTNHVGNNSGFDVDGNYVVAYGRAADGTLRAIGLYETGGKGSGARPNPGDTPRFNPLIAEDSLIAADDRYLLAVNAGSNTVTSFRINADFTLSRVDVEPSGGSVPISLAYRNGVVYVANADEDGTFTTPADQSGNIVAMRLDRSTGELSRIEGFSLRLKGRPSDLEMTPGGEYLIASSLNAASPLLPQPTAAEVSSFRILADGTLADRASGTGMSTPIGNAAGRNLPNAIGIETYAVGGRQFVIAAEARTVSSTGAPASSFASLQTGSVSTWEIAADGALLPRTQDFLLGSSATSGPTQAGFLAYSSATSTFWVSTSAGATISGYGLNADGTIARGERVASGAAVDPASANPIASADGYVDVAISPDGRWLYQLVGLKGRINVYEIDTLVSFNLALRQQTASGTLPADNLQGLVAVGARAP